MSNHDCASEDKLLAYVQRLLPPSETAAIEAHLGDCESCGRLVAEAARDLFGTEAATAMAPPTTLEVGRKLGRHIILGVIGRGATGVVYSAYDPELDRRVALKLLRPGVDHAVLRERLLREGQAMARLSHPNVVTVYDVGVVDDDVFLAMEYIEGQTLGAWLRAEARPWQAIVAAFLDAARGLAAAHRAGLVHRDFKPDNALVGKDGRVRVTDFGLARRGGRLQVSSSSASLPAARSLSLTQTGAVLGTPAYMSPEQLRGEEAGVPSDIFSLCAALWQALYGSHPFPTESFAQLREAVLHGGVREPSHPGAVPGHVRRALLRGLRPSQQERFSSMDELVAALSNDPVARRKRAALVAVPIFIAVAAVGSAVLIQQRARMTCRAGGARLASVWSEAKKSSLRSAFAQLGVSYSAGVSALVERTLDEYGRRWVDGYTEACEATQVRGDQSAALLDRRMQCLDARLRDLDALVDALGHADRGVLDKAPASTASLRGVEACADRQTLLALSPDPEEAQTRPRLDAARALLSQTRASGQTGRYKEGLDTAKKVIDEARAMKAPLLEAEALFELGNLLRGLGQANDAEATTAQALEAATRVGQKELQARAEIAIVGYLGFRRKTDEAVLWSRLALAEIERMGNDALLRADLLSARGWALAFADRPKEGTPFLEEAVTLYKKRLGNRAPAVARAMMRLGASYDKASNYREAVRWMQAALDVYLGALGPEHPETANAMFTLATAYGDFGRPHAAIPLHQQALALRQRILGPEHREVALSLLNLAMAEIALGNCREAEAHLEQALAIDEKLFGRDHPELVNVLGLEGAALSCLGRTDEALERAHRAVELAAKHMGVDSPMVAFTTVVVAAALERAERYDEADEEISRAIAVLTKAEPDHSDLAGMWNLKGRILRRRGRLDEALALHRRALALAEKTFGDGHSNVIESLVGVGAVQLARRSSADAVTALERAAKIAEGAEIDPLQLAEVRLDLAEALAASKKDVERAATLLAAARKSILESPHAGPELRRRAR
jgi:serine/threonine protein kinase/tetratricopeptide (TPR) repeat protein